jgi:aerobic carbon-monoxide dehydrogenase large subunit
VSILGNRVLRKEDARFLRGEGRYVENLPLEGALAVAFVRSQLAHARVTVDASAAKEQPGVVQVFTGADVDIGPLSPPPLPGVNAEMTRPPVAKDVVRFVGEIVAIVVAESREAGVDAAELVAVDYDPLPAAVTPQEAVKDETLLFPDLGTNVAARQGSTEHDDTLFDGCDVVVSDTVHSQRLAPCPLEPRSASAVRGPDERITAWLSTQTPHQDLQVLAGTLGLEPAQLRVISPDVGGGFGAKTLSVEEILIVWLASRLDRPVRWTETRSESMVALQHGRAQRGEFTIGGTRDGKILAYRLDVLQDSGAYPVVGAFLPELTREMASGVYAIPRIEFDGTTVVTNTTPITAFRGAGRPEACQAIERAVDVFASEIGLDPIDVRRRNFIPKDAFPHTTATGATYDSGDYEGALDRALDAVGLDELRAEQAQRREAGAAKQLGIGISVYIEITNAVAETEFGQIEIAADGSATLRTGSFSHGQGHETTFAQIASDRLGIPIESITVLKGDTDEIPKGTGTYGSKSTQIGGTAARLAADEVVLQARKLAADYLEVSPEDIRFESERFQVAGVPQRAVSWPELAGLAAEDGKLDLLNATHEFQGAPTFPFGCHVAVVEVDTETCAVELLRLVSVDDAGTIVNPIIFEGQVHGGVATGVAQALYEHYVFDEHGTPVTTTFAGYAFPSAADLPSWEAVEMQTPTPVNPLGAKGVGESGTMGSTPAVQSAVIDALTPYGVRHVDLPVNGENVWRALTAATA